MDGEGGAGGETERLFRTDAAEALDGDGGEERARVRAAPLRLRRRVGRLAADEKLLDHVASVARGEDERAPFLLEQPFGAEAVADKLTEVVVHGDSNSSP